MSTRISGEENKAYTVAVSFLQNLCCYFATSFLLDVILTICAVSIVKDSRNTDA